MNPSPLKGGTLTTRDKFPCGKYPGGKCPKRQPGCQDKCPEFLEAKAVNDARKAVERAKRYAKPMWYLGESLKKLSEADVAIFAKGWWRSRGCKVEHESAVAYGIEVLYE